tara:strand:- start:410 stop:610 length:201 start_codon:yes stop_codon:yes gene_type:complete
MNKNQMRLLLAILLTTQIGCAFVVTAAGSFVGNLGADMVEEKIKEHKIEKMFEADKVVDECLKNCT